MNLIDFYCNGLPLRCANSEVLTLEEILIKDNNWWEHCHNHVQWCFPTRTPSKMNLQAPVLTQQIAKNIYNNCYDIYLRAIERFFEFLQSVTWHPYNHNYLRISRVIESYRLIIDNYLQTFELYERFINTGIPFSSLNFSFMNESLNQSWENN